MIYRYEQTEEEKARSKLGKRSRRKGHDFERELVRELNAVLPPPWVAERRLQAKGGKGTADVEIAYHGDPVFHIECKRGKRPNIRAALEQAEQDKRAGCVATACTRADRDHAVVSMFLDDFLEILKSHCSRIANTDRNRDREEG